MLSAVRDRKETEVQEKDITGSDHVTHWASNVSLRLCSQMNLANAVMRVVSLPLSLVAIAGQNSPGRIALRMAGRNCSKINDYKGREQLLRNCDAPITGGFIQVMSYELQSVVLKLMLQLIVKFEADFWYISGAFPALQCGKICVV